VFKLTTYLVNSSSRPTRIPGVNSDAASEPTIAIAPREFAQHERTVLALLALDVLVCAQGHALAEGGYDEGISDAQQGEVLREGEVLSMQEHDGLVGER
jgi:hypothetical protein